MKDRQAGSVVVEYNSDYYSKLLEYDKMVSSTSLSYFDYRINGINKDLVHKNLILLDDANNIIGCNLFFPTKASINGVEEDVLWSHDTFVNEEHRGNAGLDFMLMLRQVPKFGMGLSAINKSIQKMLKTNFIAKSYRYIKYNPWSIKLVANKLFKVSLKSTTSNNFPQTIKVGDAEFKLINSVSELNIVNGGYWMRDVSTVDFVRDENFLRHRFFENFNKYWLYSLKTESGATECYFVVRPIYERDILCMSLVDFRFDIQKPEQFKAVIKAANKITRKNRLPLLVTNTTLDHSYFQNLMRRIESYGDVVSTYKGMKSVPNLLVTRADSDGEFNAKAPTYNI